MTEEVIAHMNALAIKDGRPTDPDPIFTFHGQDIDSFPIEDTAKSISPPTFIFAPILDLEQPDHLAPLYIQPPDHNGTQRIQNPDEAIPLQHFRGDLDNAPEPPYLDDTTADDPSPRLDDTTAEDPLPNVEPTDHVEPNMTNISPREAESVPPPRRNPPRSRNPPARLNLSSIISSNKSENLSAYHITARCAMKEIPELAEPAILLELSNILKKNVFTGRHFMSLSTSQKNSIIRSAMNITQKVAPTSDGSGRTKDKVKARLVGGGDGQDRNHYTRADTSSPTFSITAIFIIAQVAAAERRHIVTLDIGSAYLNAPMPKDDPDKLVFMRIQPDIATLLCKLDPAFTQFLARDGSLVVELDQALYGCIQSALLWHTEISNFLGSLLFLSNDTDACVYNRVVETIQITIAVYVDDLIITCINGKLINEITNALRSKYNEIKVVDGPINNYLGMVLDFSQAPLLRINQTGMIEDIINTPLPALDFNISQYNTIAPPKSPAAQYLFNITLTSPLLLPAQQAEFHSTVAKILFISHRTRPDVLTAISFLTKRVLTPSTEDWHKLRRLRLYLAATKSDSLTLECTLPPRVQLYADSSFAVHPDFRSMYYIRKRNVLFKVNSTEASDYLILPSRTCRCGERSTTGYILKFPAFRPRLHAHSYVCIVPSNSSIMVEPTLN